MKGTFHYLRKTPGFKDFDMVEVGIDVEFEGDENAMKEIWQQIYEEVETKLPKHIYSDLEDTDQELEIDEMTVPPGQSLVGSTVEEAWPGKYISAKYLVAKGPLLLTIKDVRKEMLRTNFGGQKEAPKDVIYFEETDLTLPRGPGGSAQVGDAIGSSAYADWIGIKVQLVPFHLKTGKDTVRVHLPGKVPNWTDGHIIKKPAPASPQKQAEPNPAPIQSSAPASPQKPEPVTWEGLQTLYKSLADMGVDVEQIPQGSNHKLLEYAISEATQMLHIAGGSVPDNIPLRPQALRYLLQKYSQQLNNSDDYPPASQKVETRTAQVIAAKMEEMLLRPGKTAEEVAGDAEKVKFARKEMLNWLFAVHSATDLSANEGVILLRRILVTYQDEFKSPIKTLAQQEFGMLREYLEKTGVIVYEEPEQETVDDTGVNDIPF